jgi:hypothetical protein
MGQGRSFSSSRYLTLTVREYMQVAFYAGRVFLFTERLLREIPAGVSVKTRNPPYRGYFFGSRLAVAALIDVSQARYCGIQNEAW